MNVNEVSERLAYAKELEKRVASWSHSKEGREFRRPRSVMVTKEHSLNAWIVFQSKNLVWLSSHFNSRRCYNHAADRLGILGSHAWMLTNMACSNKTAVEIYALGLDPTTGGVTE